VCGADVAVQHSHRTHDLSRPPPTQKLGAEIHMLQLNIQCSWWWTYVPETCRTKNTLIKLPCCIKLAFQIISKLTNADRYLCSVALNFEIFPMSARKNNSCSHLAVLQHHLCAFAKQLAQNSLLRYLQSINISRVHFRTERCRFQFGNSLYMARPTAAVFGSRAGNMKLDIQNEGWIRVLYISNSTFVFLCTLWGMKIHW